MSRIAIRLGLALVALCAAATATAQTYTYTFFVDAGGNGAAGCSVSYPGGSVVGVRSRLDVAVSGGATPQVVAVERRQCSNGTFGAASPVNHTAALGLGTGDAGADVIELSLSLGLIGGNGGPRGVIGIAATSALGSDVLARSGAAAGAKAGAAGPTAVPGLGAFGVAVLALAVVLVARRRLAARARALLLGLAAVAGSAVAAQFVVDGQVGDWSGIAASTDPVGDASSGESAIDLVAFREAREGGTAYLRLDLRDLQDPPVANPASVTLLEDGTTTITLTGSDPAGRPLTFAIVAPPTLGTLGPVVPIGPDSASVTYAGNADAVGGDSFTFRADNGIQSSTPATVSVTLTPVNDAPSVTAGDPPAVAENAGPQTVPGFAQFDPGPADESGQAVAAWLVEAPSDPALFSVAPAVALDGTLTYTPAPDANGSASVTLRVRDDGGTADGGVDTSAPVSVTIAVRAVNGAPRFTGGGDVTAAEDDGPQLRAAWASGIDDGDPELTQGLTFAVTANDNVALFSAGPAIDAVTGDLTFTTAAEASGEANLVVVLRDDGGTADGGSDTSASFTFRIAVTESNDAPLLTAPAGTTAHTHIAIALADGAAGDLLSAATASDVDGPLPLAIGGSIPTVSAAGGVVAIDPASGAWSYDPPAGFTGIDSFAYQVCDAAPVPACSAPAAVSIAVSGPAIWFVDDDAPAGGVGTLQRPLDDLAAGLAAAGADGRVFLHAGSYASGVSLPAGLALVGQGVDGTGFDAVFGIAPPAASVARPAIDTASPRIDGGGTLALGGDNTLRGLVVGSAGGTAISGTAFGTLTVRDDVRVDGPGRALALTDGRFAVGSVFGGLSSGGGANNLALTAVDGEVDFGDGALDGASATAVLVSGGALTARYAGDITKAGGGSLLEVVGTTGGELHFDGGALAATGGAGLRFDGADGGTRITGPLTVDGGGQLVVENGSDGAIAITDPESRIADPAGEAVRVAGSSPNLLYAGAVTTTGGTGIRIAGNSGGAVTLAGPITVTADGAPAVQAAANPGTRVRVGPGRLVLSADAGHALDVESTGSLAVVGAGHRLSASNGIALRVIDTAIAADGVTVERIDATGGVHGIQLERTGTAGGLVLTGNGETESGGSIADTLSHGVQLVDTARHALTGLVIRDTVGSGVRGTGVEDFAFLAGRIENSGIAAGSVESNLAFDAVVTGTERNLSGVVAIRDCILRRGFQHGISIANHAGALTALEIENNRIESDVSGAASKGSGIRVLVRGSAAGAASLERASITGNAIRHFPAGNGIQVLAGNLALGGPIASAGDPESPTAVITIASNTVAGQSSGNRMGVSAIATGVAGAGRGHVAIVGNGDATTPIAHVSGTAISHSVLGSAVSRAEIRDNVVAAGNTFGASGIGVGTSRIAANTETPGLDVVIRGNRLSQVDGNGILVTARDASGALRATVRDNTVAAPLTGVRPGIRVDAGNGSSGNESVCLDIAGNVSAGSGGVAGIGLRKQGAVAGTNGFALVGLAPTPAAASAVEAAVATANPGSIGGALVISGDNFLDCVQP